jgi:hypothetical protein
VDPHWRRRALWLGPPLRSALQWRQPQHPTAILEGPHHGLWAVGCHIHVPGTTRCTTSARFRGDGSAPGHWCRMMGSALGVAVPNALKQMCLFHAVCVQMLSGSLGCVCQCLSTAGYFFPCWQSTGHHLHFCDRLVHGAPPWAPLQGDSWPYGMCTLKKVPDASKPQFWSTNSGHPAFLQRLCSIPGGGGVRSGHAAAALPVNALYLATWGTRLHSKRAVTGHSAPGHSARDRWRQPGPSLHHLATASVLMPPPLQARAGSAAGSPCPPSAAASPPRHASAASLRRTRLCSKLACPARPRQPPSLLHW